MSTTPAPLVSWSSQFYRALLVFFPPRFRAEYEREMVLFFRDSLRAAYRSGSPLNVFFCWLTAILDLGQAAVHQWLVHERGPGHYALQLGIGLMAGAAGGVAAGLGSRLSMRAVALVEGFTPAFTLEGTLVLVVFGVMFGTPFGAVFMALRSLLPGAGAWQGAVYGFLLYLVLLAPPLLFYREGEALLTSPLVGAGLFAPLGLLYGAVLAVVVERLEQRFYRPQAAAVETRPPIHWAGIALQLGSVALFALFLELGVLGALSVTNQVHRIPPAIVRAARDANLPFAFLRDSNNWLITLTALGYFGLASVLFWQRPRPLMARFTASMLFLFGAGLFNTGARYYAAVVSDLSALRAAFHFFQVLGFSALLALLYLFPNGRLAPAWARPLALAWLAFALAWLLLPLPEPLTLAVIVSFFLSGLWAQVQRYRAAAPEDRLSLRWPLAGFTVAIAGFGLVALGSLLSPGLKLPNAEGLGVISAFGLYMLPWLFVPTTISHAVRRHRLWAA
jgi:hypothetical protein